MRNAVKVEERSEDNKDVSIKIHYISPEMSMYKKQVMEEGPGFGNKYRSRAFTREKPFVLVNLGCNKTSKTFTLFYLIFYLQKIQPPAGE